MTTTTPAPDATSPTWTALWIEPMEPTDGPAVQRPAYHLAGDVVLAKSIDKAVLRASAHGVYEAFINGARVGDIELTPGFTAYRSRIQVHAFDVTELLRAGRNTIGALLSDGWWRGQHGVIREVDAYGPRTAFLAQLDVTYRDGSVESFGTGPAWRSTANHIVGADLITGEIHDLRRRVDGWSEPGNDRTGWDGVSLSDHGYHRLVHPISPPVRRIETIPAVDVRELAPGRHVIDFGQNISGWVRLRDLGPAGTELRIVHGEALVDGDVTIANVEHAMTPSPRVVAFQTDVVTSAGDGSVFEPRHSTKGFRYVRIEGHPGQIDAASIDAVVVHSDLRRIGSFTCSDPLINKLHDAAVWSFRGNACDIPTDCPTRERSGWVGDWQIYVDTAAELYDVADFSVKWLRDVVADQFPDGKVTSIVPDPSPTAPMWGASHGSSGWGDAIVHVPWELHRATGRTDFIAEIIGGMHQWVDFAANRAASRRHPRRVERSADPMPHERFIWDSGWHYGEWLVPGDHIEDLLTQLRGEDHGIVATAYLHRSASELAELASLVGDHAACARYSELAANVLDAWRIEFIDDNGHVRSRRQADLVRALMFSLVPNELRQLVADDLAAMIRANDVRLGTGFLATPFLLPVLADHGHVELAYELLFQRSEPSWLCMIDRGATTIWEDWDGVRGDGTVTHSLNHYSKGAVIGFLHRYTAGIQILEPGWRRYAIRPRPGGGITHAEMTHDSPFGTVHVAWHLDDSTGTLTTTVPEGASALLTLPDGSSEDLAPGSHTRKWSHP